MIWDNFFTIISTASHIKSHFTKFNDKNRVSDFSLQRTITLFIKCQNLVYEEGSFILFYAYSRLREKCIIFFSENCLKQVETCCLSIGFGALEFSFKSESLTNLSDSKRYNCLRCVHIAICFTPSSKISSPFLFRQPQIANIFQQMNMIKKQMFIILS